MEKAPLKIEPRTLTAQVAEALESAIRSGEWQIGQKIPSENTLIRVYGVSRNTLREAIHYLAMVGVLDVRPGSGTYVCSRTVFDAVLHNRLEEADITSLMETRLLIEPSIAALAAQRRTDEEAVQLMLLHEGLEQSYLQQRLLDQPDYSEYITQKVSFHHYLARLCHNSLLTDLYGGILQLYPKVLGCTARPFFSYRELCLAIQKGEETAAKFQIEQLLKEEFHALKVHSGESGTVDPNAIQEE